MSTEKRGGGDDLGPPYAATTGRHLRAGNLGRPASPRPGPRPVGSHPRSRQNPRAGRPPIRGPGAAPTTALRGRRERSAARSPTPKTRSPDTLLPRVIEVRDLT